MSTDDTKRTAAIQENLTSPQSVTTRDGAATAHSLPDQIAADRYLASKAAAGDAFSALRPRKMVPPSSVGSDVTGGP